LEWEADQRVHPRDRLRPEHLQLLLQPLLRTGAARDQRSDYSLASSAALAFEKSYNLALRLAAASHP
jgi:hypothetical protein